VAALLSGLFGGCLGEHAPTVEAAPSVEPSEPSEPSEAVAVPEPIPEPEPKPVKADSLELTFVGDVVLGRYRANEVFYEMHPPDADPFYAVRDQLAADVVIGNLESPLMFEVPELSPSKNKWRFAGGAEHAPQLRNAGFTVMSLANNHYYDLGVAGQLESPQILIEAGLMPIGASREQEPLLRVETLEVQGWRIGFIACSTRQNSSGSSKGPKLPLVTLREFEEVILPLVVEARPTHDLVIVSVHWGDEYVDDPGPSRRLAARELLEAGVDLLIGHHPHVLQGLAVHPSGDDRDGLVAYSLGNFLFPRSDLPSGLSGVLRVRYQARADQRPCLEQARVHPVILRGSPLSHPEAATGVSAERVRDRLVPLSRAAGTIWEREPSKAPLQGDATEVERSEDLLATGLRGCVEQE
jgi:poly-gamma-glutamate capsule biosynthesis protein CapA/YwtB (metallophosphatase superfamily)